METREGVHRRLILPEIAIKTFHRVIETFIAYFVRWLVIALDGARFANTTELIKRGNVSNTTAALAVLKLPTINLTHAPTEENVESARDFIILTFIRGRCNQILSKQRTKQTMTR